MSDEEPSNEEPNAEEAGSRLNRVVFMNSALNTEVGSLNRIEYLTLSTIQFHSIGSAITHYSRVPFRILPPVSTRLCPFGPLWVSRSM